MRSFTDKGKTQLTIIEKRTDLLKPTSLPYRGLPLRLPSKSRDPVIDPGDKVQVLGQDGRGSASGTCFEPILFIFTPSPFIRLPVLSLLGILQFKLGWLSAFSTSDSGSTFLYSLLASKMLLPVIPSLFSLSNGFQPFTVSSGISSVDRRALGGAKTNTCVGRLGGSEG